MSKTAEEILDELLIKRGEHPSRVRNPIYSEERKLAIDFASQQLAEKEKEIELLGEKLDKKHLKITGLETKLRELEIKNDSYATTYTAQITSLKEEVESKSKRIKELVEGMKVLISSEPNSGICKKLNQLITNKED